ncbi:MAG TPA: CoA transferase [Chloroflexota bacterium]|nr:CoA transferase [Chloroflexota bacterium]
MSDTLEGVRVLDLTRMLSGPYGSLILADMGAEVIKIEPPGEGDPMREMGPPFLEGHTSAYFLAANRNKKSVTLDLSKPEGKNVFLRLVKHADVVFENFRPGVTQRLGIYYQACKVRNRGIIYCSLSGFGQDGPYRDLPAFDLVLQAMGGGMSITGEPGGAPVRAGVPLGDLAGGMFAATAISAALWRRDRTGEGQYIDVSLLDAQVSMLTYVAQYYLADGRVPGPAGSAHQSVVPYQAFKTQDIWIVVAIFVERHWASFCEALELPELAADRRFATNPDRLHNRAELVQLLTERFQQRSGDEWIARLRAAGVAAGPINTVDRVLSDPQVLHRGMVASVEHPVAGSQRILGNPIKSGSRDEFQPSPLLGQHTDEVLAAAGLSPAEIDALRDKKII